MCPPFCFFMPAVSCTTDHPSLAILRRVSRSCSKTLSPCPNPPRTLCSRPLARVCGDAGVRLASATAVIDTPHPILGRPAPFRGAATAQKNGQSSNTAALELRRAKKLAPTRLLPFAHHRRKRTAAANRPRSQRPSRRWVVAQNRPRPPHTLSASNPPGTATIVAAIPEGKLSNPVHLARSAGGTGPRPPYTKAAQSPSAPAS